MMIEPQTYRVLPTMQVCGSAPLPGPSMQTESRERPKMVLDASTWITIAENIVSIVLPLGGIAYAIYRKVSNRFTDIDNQISEVRLTVGLLVDAEEDREPGFYDRVKRVGKEAGVR